MDRAQAMSLAYVIIGLLTTGYAYNTSDYRHCHLERCEFARTMVSMARGVFWPLYFGGRAAIIVTKPLAD